MEKLKIEDPKISFEVAKLAKEYGLPQEGFNTGWYNDLGSSNGRSDVDINGKEYGGYKKPPLEIEHLYEREMFLAPKQNILVTWFREVHGIIVYVVPSYYDGYIFTVKIMTEEPNDWEYSDSYDYVKVLDMGLKEAFNYIKK